MLGWGSLLPPLKYTHAALGVTPVGHMGRQQDWISYQLSIAPPEKLCKPGASGSLSPLSPLLLLGVDVVEAGALIHHQRLQAPWVKFCSPNEALDPSPKRKRRAS